MTFEPIRTLRPFEDAVRQIVDAIRREDLRVGERLPSERVLARLLDISRPTLREALRLLIEARVLSAGPDGRTGHFVATDTIPGTLETSPEPVSYERVGELLEFRRMFEPRVAQLAGFRATEVDFSALEDALAQLRGSRSERGRFMLQDERFQLRMARATHNEVVMGVFSRLFKDLRIVRDLALRDDTESATEWAIDSLTRLLTAIMSRDPQAIDRQVGEHLDYLEAVWRKRTGRSVARDVPDFLKGRLSGREVDGRDGSHSRYEAVLASGGV